jgi:protein TonB
VTHDYPIVHLPVTPVAPKLLTPATGLKPGSWRYPSVGDSRWSMAFALILSATFHAVLLLGFRGRTKPPPPVVEKPTIAVNFVVPLLKDLEQPEPAPRDDAADKLDPAEFAPTLMDAPSIPLPNQFTQQIDFASLIPPPDTAQAKVFVIPHNIGAGTKLGEGLGNIFNLAELDRVPEPTVQPAPIFPYELKREVSYARVVVEFIVDTEGRVRSPISVEETHPGFINAALTGVEKWRFHPGMKTGKRVNTRMSVPIIFRIADPSS